MGIKNWFTEHKPQIKLAIAKLVLFVGLVMFLSLSLTLVFASLFDHSDAEIVNIRAAIFSILTAYIAAGVATAIITRRFLSWLYRITIINIVLYSLFITIFLYGSPFDYFYQSLRVEMLIGVFISLILFFIFFIFPMHIIKKARADAIETRPSKAALITTIVVLFYIPFLILGFWGII